MTKLMKNISFPIHNHLDNQKGNFRRNAILAALVFIALALTLSAPWAQASDYSLTPLYCTDANETHANGINNLGQISGSYGLANGFDQSFIYNNGSFTLIPEYQQTGTYPSINETIAIDINDAGQICGNYDERISSNSWIGRGFIINQPYSSDDLTRISFDNSTTTNTYGINNNGEVLVVS